MLSSTFLRTPRGTSAVSDAIAKIVPHDPLVAKPRIRPGKRLAVTVVTVDGLEWWESMYVRLSPAERRLLPYLATYRSLDAIAADLFLSRNTVKTQARSLYTKLGTASRGEAVERAVSLGLVHDPLLSDDC